MVDKVNTGSNKMCYYIIQLKVSGEGYDNVFSGVGKRGGRGQWKGGVNTNYSTKIAFNPFFNS